MLIFKLSVYTPLSLTFLFVFSCSAMSANVTLDNKHLANAISVKSWKAIRDANVVKQNLDYSCGAASLATLLNEQYSMAITEEDVLRVMYQGDTKASFEDMAFALSELGFRGIGYAASYEQLTKLKIPVIVYTKHRKNEHFSVLRGIDNDTVWISDPSLGQITYSKHQFLKMWETRGDATLKGKILAVIPKSDKTYQLSDFFTNQPQRQTFKAVQHAINRNHIQ